MVFFILVLAYHNSYPTVRFQYEAVIHQRLLSSESGRLKNHGLGALLIVNNGNF